MRRARTRLDDERCESTRNCWSPGPLLGKGAIHKGYNSRLDYRGSFLCSLHPLRQLYLPLVLEQGWSDNRTLGSCRQSRPRTVSCRADTERLQRRRAACQFERCRLRLYLSSATEGGLRSQGPAELTHDCPVRVSPNNRPLPAILSILSHSNDRRHSGRARNPRLPRNRIAACSGHHALARPRNRGTEETMAKPVHRPCPGSESASDYSANSWNPLRDRGCYQGPAERACCNCQCRPGERDPGRARLSRRSSIAVCLAWRISGSRCTDGTRTFLRTSRSLNTRRGKIRSPEPNFPAGPAWKVDLVDSSTEREDSDQQDSRSPGSLHQRHVPLRLPGHLCIVRVFPVFTDLVSLHPLHHRILRVRDSVSVDRERAPLDPEIITRQYAEIRERSLPGAGCTFADLSYPSYHSSGCSPGLESAVHAVVVAGRGLGASRRVGDCGDYNGWGNVLRITIRPEQRG